MLWGQKKKIEILLGTPEWPEDINPNGQDRFDDNEMLHLRFRQRKKKRKINK